MLKAAYINEMYKISKKKKLIVASILAASVLLAACAAIMGIDNIAGIKMSIDGNFPLLVLPFFEYALIPLFSAFICIDMFSGEFANDTIKLTFTRPASRFKIFTSKTLASATFIFAFLIFTFVVSALFSLIFGFSFKVLVSGLKAYIISFVPLMVLSQMVILISNVSKGSASAFLISIVIFIILKVLELKVGGSRYFLFTAGFDWYNLFLGSYTDFGRILRMSLIFIGYEMAFFSAGYYFFEKRSI